MLFGLGSDHCFPDLPTKERLPGLAGGGASVVEAVSVVGPVVFEEFSSLLVAFFEDEVFVFAFSVVEEVFFSGDFSFVDKLVLDLVFFDHHHIDDGVVERDSLLDDSVGEIEPSVDIGAIEVDIILEEGVGEVEFHGAVDALEVCAFGEAAILEGDFFSEVGIFKADEFLEEDIFKDRFLVEEGVGEVCFSFEGGDEHEGDFMFIGHILSIAFFKGIFIEAKEGLVAEGGIDEGDILKAGAEEEGASEEFGSVEIGFLVEGYAAKGGSSGDF